MNILKLIQDRLQRRPTEGGYIPQIDGLRFVAIFIVVLQHMSERLLRFANPPIAKDDFSFFISRGTIGVFIFFAISGFVLAIPFALHNRLNEKGLKAFYWRRLERIEPPYLVWMTFFALILIFKGTYTLGEMMSHWLASVTYTHFLFFNDYSVINPVAWSLEIEIQFYLIAPFLATFYFNFPKKVARRVGLVAFIVAYVALQYSFGWLSFPMKATLLGRLPNFLVGFLIADFYLNEWKNQLNKNLIWDAVAAVSFVAMCYTWTEELAKTIVFNLLLILFFIAAFKGQIFSWFLSKKWIAITGGMCYTIYLIHLPLLEGFMRLTTSFNISSVYAVDLLIQAVLVLPLVWLSSIVFFLILEKPFMKKNWWKEWKEVGFIAKFHQFRKRVAALFFFLFFTIVTINAQGSLDSATTAMNIKIKPLSVLIELAIQNAVQLKQNQTETARQTLAWQLQKTSIMDNLFVNGTTLYGNGSAIDANNTGAGTTYILSGRKTLNFNVSMGVRVSAGDFFNRSKKTEMQRLQIDRLAQDKQLIEQQITEQVSILYTQLELALKVLQIKADVVENQRVILTMTEKFYKEGRVQPSEFSMQLTKVSEAEEMYEKAKSEVKKLILVLKNIVGDYVLES